MIRSLRSELLASAALFALAGCSHSPPAQNTGTPDAGNVSLDASVPDASEAADASVDPPVDAEWWRDDVFYEIFVRSFADSNGDGIGDLRGLTAKLDVLNDGDPATRSDLGVDALWLMPIFVSPSYHGYDVVDYRAVDPDYGTLEDFDTFIAAARARKIRVVLDFVLNHSSSEHPYFIDAISGPNAEHRKRYNFRADNPGWRQPWPGGGATWHSGGGAYYYGIFWSGMPDWNLGEPSVEADLIDAMRFWMRRGVSGFRIDAARHLFESSAGVLSDQPETHAFIKRARAALSAEFPEVVLIAEAWTSTQEVAPYYGDADEFQLAFGFDTSAAIKSSLNAGESADLARQLQRVVDIYAEPAFEAPFLANHDMVRVATELNKDRGAMRVALATLMALPGTPFLYYGEEIGMAGGIGNDEGKRTPMRWNAADPELGFTTGTPWYSGQEEAGVDVASQREVSGSLWTLYRDLIALRHGQRALARGAISQPAITGGGPGTIAVSRVSADGRRVLFVANFDRLASAPVEVASTGAPRVLHAEGLSRAIEVKTDALNIALGPQSWVFIGIEK